MKSKKLAIFSIIFSFLLASTGLSQDNRRISSTSQDMEQIGEAVENYVIDHGKAPEAESMKALASVLEPQYIEELPLRDGWGRNFHYFARNTTAGDGDIDPEYWLGSSGSNTNFDGFLKYMLKIGNQEGAIVYNDGEFV